MSAATPERDVSFREAPALPTEPGTCLFCGPRDSHVLGRGRDYEYDTTPAFFDVRRCAGCGLGFLDPRPAAGAMGTIYPANYYAYHEGESEVPLVKWFRDRMERTKVRRYQGLVSGPTPVVDIGCGDGRLLEILQRFGPSDWDFAGIELGGGAAARAAARGFEVLEGDFESLDVSAWRGRFGLALMHHVIEHTRDPRGAVAKAHGLLRPGGLFSVETPDLRGWDARLFRRRYWGGYHFPRHFFLFEPHTLGRLLVEEGFEVVSVRSIPSPAFWTFSAHNALVDRRWGRRLARFFHPQNLLVVAGATALDVVQLLAVRRSSNLQVLARKRP